MRILFTILCFTLSVSATAQEKNYDPAKDQKLDQFLQRFGLAIEHHAWNEVLGCFFDEANYRTQHELGVEAPQYIEEGLGLGMVDNHLIDRTADGSDFHRLNGITKIQFKRGVLEGGLIVVRGTVTLWNKETRKITLYLTRLNDGGFRITPAVG